MRKILFISNGHGEDLVAVEMIKKLAGKAEISVLPVVGEGKPFKDLKVKVLGPMKKLPSGGFSLRNLLYLPQDIYAGLIGNTLEQIGLLRELQGGFDLAVAIGDIVPIIGALLVKSPFIFVGVNKSDYYKWFGSRYTLWEKLLLQRYALKVYTRDRITEQNLKSRGIKIPSAEYAGNPLMDCINSPVQRPGNPDPRLVNIGFLPGTRDDAKLNLEDFDRIAEEIIKLKHADIKFKFVTATALKNVPGYMENMSFADLLAVSDLVIGLSGTGNEQAAGSGIPVISFYGSGSQYNARFGEAQKELLGEALLLVRDHDPLSVAAEVWQLLHHPEKMKHMGRMGRERMGSAGAVEKICEYITKNVLER
jgi:hypothetical protein